MPAYRARGVVLKKTKLGETDIIVTMLAEDGRQLRAVAKAARKPGSRIGARLEPFSAVRLLLHTGRTLDVVSEVETERSHEGLRADFDRTANAAVVADLLERASVEGQADPRLHELALATLDAMEVAPLPALPALTLAFLLKAMAMLGFRPQLAACVECAGKPGAGARFSPDSGGVVCEACAGDATLPITPRTHALLASLMRARMREVAETEPPREAVAEGLALARAFVSHHIPGRLKSLEFLERYG